jgi:hypothetical protein
MDDQPLLPFGPGPPPPPPPEDPPEYPTGIPRDVLLLFEQLAMQLSANGWSHYSSDAILHRIRWHYHVERDMRDFKCNNNWTSKMARWFIKRHPLMEAFFELRSSPGTVPGAGDGED